MSGIPATFWSSPIRYLRWAQHEKPAIFWSIVLGALGPPILVAGRPFREWIGDEIPKAIPTSYPVPKGPRKRPEGFDDPSE